MKKPKMRSIRFTPAELVALRMGANFALKRWPFSVAFNGALESARDKIALASKDFTEKDWADPLPPAQDAPFACGRSSTGLNQCCTA